MNQKSSNSRKIKNLAQEKSDLKNLSPLTISKNQGHTNIFPEISAQILPGNAPISERILRTTTTKVEHQTFNGPIPHPEIFRKYGEVIKDAPERILRVFEEDSKHARETATNAMQFQRDDNRREHWMVWSTIVGGYVMAGLFAWAGKDWLAGVVLTTTIIGTVTGFLQGQKKISSESIDDKKE